VKREKKEISQSGKSLLLFITITLPIWYSDDALVDQIAFPKTLVYLIFSTIYCIFSIKTLMGVLRKNFILSLILIVLSLYFLTDLPAIENFFGESQRLNGTVMILVIALSISLGVIIVQEERISEFISYVNLNSLLISMILLTSQFITLENSILDVWLKPNAEGGLNENFKSLFVSISTVLLCSTFPKNHLLIIREKTKLFLLLIHIVALALIGSLQGFVVLFLWGLIITLSSGSKLRFGIPIFSFTFTLGYITTIFNDSFFHYFDSSNQERILLSRRAFKLLESAPIISPDVYRISESNFSNSVITALEGTDFWVDDVHNLYLNLANTFGILPSLLLLIFVISIILTYTKDAHSLSFPTRWVGSLLISMAFVETITVIHIIYLPLVSILVGIYLSLRFRERKQLISEVQYGVHTISFKGLLSKNVSKILVLVICLQSVVGIGFLIREYVNQRQVNSFLKTQFYSQVDPFQDFVLPKVANSRDIRFIFEVGIHRYQLEDCGGATEVLMVLDSHSPNHFLTKKLAKFIKVCSPPQ
jgi:hypothetical protein